MLFFAAVLFCPADSGASHISFGATRLYSTEPFEHEGSQVGSTYGIQAGLEAEVAEGLNFRADIGYLRYERLLYYKRIPLFAGARRIFRLKGADLYAELGMELHFDKEEIAGVGAEYENNFGLAPGVGISYPLPGPLSLGAGLRYHYVDDAYFTAGLSIGINLPLRGHRPRPEAPQTEAPRPAALPFRGAFVLK